MGSHFLLQAIFLTQGSNQCLLHCQADSLPLSHLGSPLYTITMYAAAKSLQSCPTLCDPMECSLPGFSVHGILQARTLRWVALSFSEHVCVHAKLLQSCLTLYNPMDCRLPGSSVQRILQARILEWVAMLFSRGSSPPRD